MNATNSIDCLLNSFVSFAVLKNFYRIDDKDSVNETRWTNRKRENKEALSLWNFET